MSPMVLVFVVPVTAVVTLAVWRKFHREITTDDVSEAYDEGYRKASEKVHDEYEKRRVMTDKLYRRVMRIYNGEIERARLEVKHLRVMAGLEQEGVE